MNDLLERLAALPDADPSPVRATRARALARRRLKPRPAETGPASPPRRAPLVWLAAGVSAVYLVKVLAVAVEVLGARSGG